MTSEAVAFRPKQAHPLAQVIATEQLKRRTPRPTRPAAESRALRRLARGLAEAPESILQTLCEVALNVCDADTAGISILEKEESRAIFRWRGVAGVFAPHLGGMTPREFSPCGTTMDRGEPQLFSHLARHFTYFKEVRPEIVEALLVPFLVDDVPVGTIWVVAHDERRKFDPEDARVLTTMATFAAAGFSLLNLLKRRLEQTSVGTRPATREIGESLHDRLSPREMEVMSRIIRGMPQKEIGFELGISVKTVATHRVRLMDKLKVNGSFELLRYGLDHGLVDWSEVR